MYVPSTKKWEGGWWKGNQGGRKERRRKEGTLSMCIRKDGSLDKRQGKNKMTKKIEKNPPDLGDDSRKLAKNSLKLADWGFLYGNYNCWEPATSSKNKDIQKTNKNRK
jgi:hypothetical protein